MALVESAPDADPGRDQITVEAYGAQRAIVWMSGEHDLATVTGLAETMARAVAHNDADVVADLSGVEFMDASTLGVMMRAEDFLLRRSRALVVRAPSRSARRVLEIAGAAGALSREGS